jgi:hypothetical protein
MYVDRSDHWLRTGVQQRLRCVNPLLTVPAIEADFARRGVHALLHAADVAARAKALARACQHQGADGFVGRHRLQCGYELCAHVVAHGVALVGAVECERGDGVVDGHFNQLVVHGHFVVAVVVQSALMLFSFTIFLQRASSAFT